MIEVYITTVEVNEASINGRLEELSNRWNSKSDNPTTNGTGASNTSFKLGGKTG